MKQRLYSHYASAVTKISHVVDVAVAIIAICTLVSIIVYVGFEHTVSSHKLLRAIIKGAEALFLTAITWHLIFNFRTTVHRTRPLMWIVDILLVTTLLPIAWQPMGRAWSFVVLTIYSVVILSFATMRLLERRINPSLLMAVSFTALIVIGALLLMMPKCTTHGITFIDSLFVSTSAVCITGLTPVDVATTFTPLGHAIIATLFEIGGLGIITFTSFFAIFFSGNKSIYNQLLVKDLVYSKSINALIPTLLYILTFTVVIEAAGAVAIYFTTPDALGMATGQKAAFAVFHSMSAFCNAGFSTLPDGMSNTVLMQGNQMIYIVLSVLIFAGAIGFPILVNAKQIIASYIKRIYTHIVYRRRLPHPVHIYDLNTKIVLYSTLIVLLISTLLFYILEYNNTLAGMDQLHKWVQSLFNSLTPRSAGFASVNPASFLNVTLCIVLIQMWIGGASQSMGGGIKVNTLGVVCCNLVSIIRNRRYVSAFKRNISIGSVRKANAVVFISIISIFVVIMSLLLLEPQLSVRDLVFEAFSALFTVGSSLGVTAKLGVASKLILCIAMFLGRVGVVSLLTGLMHVKNDKSVHYPSDNVIIN